MKTAIALGTFDGLHIGHRAVIEKTMNFYSIAVTFEIPPKNIICGESQLLILPDERKKLLKSIGINQVDMQKFEDVRTTDAEEYLYLLCEKYNPSRIVCGFNYRFGKEAKGDTTLIAEYCQKNNIEFCCVPPQCDGSQVVSSTAIREYIKSGDIEAANKLLYTPFSFTEKVIHGDARGRTLGFPTANQNYPQLLVKAKFGVYISKVTVDNKTYDAITNIGIRPTFETDNIGCETYIKDFNGEIYGKQIKTQLLKFVRTEQKFNSIFELKEAISKDIALLK